MPRSCGVLPFCFLQTDCLFFLKFLYISAIFIGGFFWILYTFSTLRSLLYTYYRKPINFKNMYDLIIVGGGPAAIAAGIYAGRKKINTVLITDTFGGQSVVSAEIQNFIGISSVSGFDLADKMEKQLRAHDAVLIHDGDLVVSVSASDEKSGLFSVLTKNGDKFESKTLLIAAGSKRRKLNIPGEKEYDGKGVAYCSTCDAPLFNGKKVIVVGGGNAGLESVVDLIPYASEIFLFHRGDFLKGDPVTIDRVQKEKKVNIFLNTELIEIKGDSVVRNAKYKNIKTGEEKEMPIDGVFVEIGWIPNSDIVNGLVEVNKMNEIIIDHKTQRTSREGIWAAGDVSDVSYKQNNISIGDGIKAILNIYEYLNKK